MKKKKKLRQLIRRLHLAFDSIIGRLFFRQNTLVQSSKYTNHQTITPNDFLNYRYSKRDHFKNFRILPVHNDQTLATCDLKVYQDSLAYTFIIDNMYAGARILEIGGGESRIINELKDQYEFWNLDKLEGSGFGPKQLFITEGFNLVEDYIGNFSPDLPDSYFDLIISISTIEHISQDSETINNVFDDIMRLLKPGGYSLHCIDALLFQDYYFVHPFVSKVFKEDLINYQEVTFDELTSENDIWLLPAFAFYTRWYHLVKKTMNNFGYPFSINLLWQK